MKDLPLQILWKLIAAIIQLPIGLFIIDCTKNGMKAAQMSLNVYMILIGFQLAAL